MPTFQEMESPEDDDDSEEEATPAQDRGSEEAVGHAVDEETLPKSIRLATGCFKCFCYHSFKKNEPPHKLQVALCLVSGVVKVIPLKLFYYQTFFETWRTQHSRYEN